MQKIGVRLTGRMIHGIDGSSYSQPYGPNEEEHYLLSVPRPELNAALLDACDEEPNVNLHFGHKLVNLELPKKGAEESTVNMTFDQPGAPGRPIRKEFKSVLGCDGMYSRVRQSMQRKGRFNFQQAFIPAGYKELLIPAKEAIAHALSRSALHIWPRGKFMMIAQPNKDGSFSCTLFMPFSAEHSPSGSFDALQTEADVQAFFDTNFPDAIPLLPTLLADWFSHPTNPLCTVRCWPFHHGGSACLVGDSAHAIVPFYGQGCNSAFEDCRVLSDIWDAHAAAAAGGAGVDLDRVYSEFAAARKPNVDAIADLAIEHYHELADRTNSPLQRLRGRFDNVISELYPGYISLYHAVSFTTIPYREARAKAASWDKVVAATSLTVMLSILVAGLAALAQMATRYVR